MKWMLMDGDGDGVGERVDRSACEREKVSYMMWRTCNKHRYENEILVVLPFRPNWKRSISIPHTPLKIHAHIFEEFILVTRARTNIIHHTHSFRQHHEKLRTQQWTSFGKLLRQPKSVGTVSGVYVYERAEKYFLLVLYSSFSLTETNTGTESGREGEKGIAKNEAAQITIGTLDFSGKAFATEKQ